MVFAGLLTLRRMRPGDVDDIHAYQSREDVSRYLLYPPRDRDTVLKINISWQVYYPGCSTTPWQLEGVIKTLVEDGHRPDDLLGVHNRTVVVDSRVGEVAKLPSLSSTYTSLNRTVNDPDSSIGAVSKIIEQDMAMSAKVLQLSNSAFFGLAKEVTSVSHAVSYLGMQTIKNLVLTAEVFSVFVPDGKTPLDCDLLQKHAHRTAAIVGKLPLDAKGREIAIVASLLHDVGQLFLASKMPQKLSAAFDLAKQRGCELFEAEEELLGSSHAEIGAYLLGLWGIPHLAVEAIAHHHRPTRIAHSGLDSAAAVYVAHVLAHEPARSRHAGLRRARATAAAC